MGPASPVLVQGGKAVVAAADTAGTGVSQLPILGKLAGMTPRSVQASLDRNGYGIDLDT